MDPNDKEETLFATPFGLYQFCVVPFGLCNAPATLQCLMVQVLVRIHWTCCLIYLDDIIVFMQSLYLGAPEQAKGGPFSTTAG